MLPSGAAAQDLREPRRRRPRGPRRASGRISGSTRSARRVALSLAAPDAPVFRPAPSRRRRARSGEADPRAARRVERDVAGGPPARRAAGGARGPDRGPSPRPGSVAAAPPGCAPAGFVSTGGLTRSLLALPYGRCPADGPRAGSRHGAGTTARRGARMRRAGRWRSRAVAASKAPALLRRGRRPRLHRRSARPAPVRRPPARAPRPARRADRDPRATPTASRGGPAAPRPGG